MLEVFLDAVEQHKIPHRFATDLIEGARMDLDRTRYQSFAQLREYCYRTSGTMSVLMAHLIGYRGPALEYMADLGLAMELTSILRTVGDALARGRIYLPLEEIESFGYSEAELLQHTRNSAFRTLMGFQAERARSYYRRVAPGLDLLDRRGRFAVRVAYDLSVSTLSRIEASDFDVFQRRPESSRGGEILDHRAFAGRADDQAAVEKHECLAVRGWPSRGPNWSMHWGLHWSLQWIARPVTVAAAIFAVVTSVCSTGRADTIWRSRCCRAVPAGETPPDCMVVIPARNEEGVVGDAVKSFPPDTVIVVDDRSTDRTAEEAREAGAGVLEAPPLAKGALGKANACMAGARILTSRWILFADADTRYQKEFPELRGAVRRRSRTGFPFGAPHAASGEPGRTPARAVRGRPVFQRRESAAGSRGDVQRPVHSGAPGGVRVRGRSRRGVEVPGRGRETGACWRRDIGWDSPWRAPADLGHVRSYAGWKGAWSGIERKRIPLRPGESVDQPDASC